METDCKCFVSDGLHLTREDKINLRAELTLLDMDVVLIKIERCYTTLTAMGK